MRENCPATNVQWISPPASFTIVTPTPAPCNVMALVMFTAVRPYKSPGWNRNRVAVLRPVVMHPLYTTSQVVVPCPGSIGWPNSSERVRRCQKSQSGSNRKKFSHIRSFFCWAFFDFLLTAHLLANLLAEAPLPGRDEGCHYDSSVLAVFYLVRSGLPKMG